MGTRGATTAAKTTIPRLSQDKAWIGLMIGAMEANQHVSAAEAARAHHILWSMRRFRRRSGDVVGRLIADTKALVGRHGALTVVAASCRALPRRQHEAAFAVVTDLVLVDGTLEPAERRFLDRVSADLGLERQRAAEIVSIMRVKNSA